jgi:hypothetical protein
VCYDLRIASPLTLSEVRSMLPAGIAADVLPAEQVARYRALLPAAQTVARLTVGRCSCDLVRPRQADYREDERDLRRRYTRLGLPRDRIIRELERHRRGPIPPTPPAGWRAALAGFVAEHARNAGPTLYHLIFLPDGDEPSKAEPARRTVADVRADPDGWLDEARPLLVVR